MGWLRLGVRVSASYSTVIALIQYYTARGSVRVQEYGLVPVIALIQFCTYLVTIIPPRGSVRVRSKG